ncbi:hypothetical protein ISF6_4764 [Piscinibacter sakaiensis]|uniref:Signal transduction histidine kinase n=1 Tax=Piscinibacter sakaiensis TaxID=1547922 RepID=A0A0K8P6R6_PISS1|nr:hypothetical protein ISF6_4764 [Piscinibacter sakaiensis]
MLVLCLVLLLTGVFALLNWTAFATPMPLSLGVTTVEAPLGLIMLGLVVVLSVAFVAWALALQAQALMDTRRMTRELQTQRELADKAEASRFTELRAHLDQALAEQRRHVEQQANGLAAAVAELEDRLDRRQALGPATPALAPLATGVPVAAAPLRTGTGLR